MPKNVRTDYPTKVRKPDDFDEFWSGVLDDAAKIPLNPETVPDPLRSSQDIEVFYDSLDNVRIAA